MRIRIVSPINLVVSIMAQGKLGLKEKRRLSKGNLSYLSSASSIEINFLSKVEFIDIFIYYYITKKRHFVPYYTHIVVYFIFMASAGTDPSLP